MSYRLTWSEKTMGNMHATHMQHKCSMHATHATQVHADHVWDDKREAVVFLVINLDLAEVCKGATCRHWKTGAIPWILPVMYTCLCTCLYANVYTFLCTLA